MRLARFIRRTSPFHFNRKRLIMQADSSNFALIIDKKRKLRMMIPISKDINTEEELGTMNLEVPVYECYSHGEAFGVRLPSGEQTEALFADIRAAQAVADYFTAAELAPEHLSCVMEDLCHAVRTLPRLFTYAELSGLHAPD